MPKVDVTALDKELKSGTVRSVYAMVGPESYLARGSVGLVKKAVHGDESDEMSLSSYTGSEAKAELVINALRTVSLMGGRPLVIIRDADKMPKDTVEALATYLKSPVESSTLVLIAEKLDGRSKMMQLLGKAGLIVECKPLYENKIPYWINMQVKRGDKSISQEAAKFMAEMVGNDLGQLSQAIERVSLYVGDRKTIELTDVEQAIAETHQRTIFELTDAVGKRNLSLALSLLHNILENAVQPVMIVTMLARHFRILIKAKEVEGRMNGQGELAKYLGVHPFFLKNYLQQSKNFSNSELRRSFSVLHHCDREIKSSRVVRERILERALFKLIGK
jgi:DNA polymerase III subunit delta